MSTLEAAADEERREIMNILEGRDPNHGITGRHVPPPIRTRSPARPIRSMLDIGNEVPRHNSVAGPSITSPLRSAPLTSSMLNPLASPTFRNTASSSIISPDGLNRTRSDGSAILPNRPRADSDQDTPYGKDQFGMTSVVSGPAAPKRVAQGGKKLGSMATVMQGQELDPLFPLGMNRDRGRHNSTAGILGGHHHSKSPSSRLNKRSNSPATSMLNTNSFNLLGDPGKYVSETGKVIDLNSAWRKLSDAHLLKAGSSLSKTSADDHVARARLNSGEVLSPTGELRLQKDYDEDAVESSDDDNKTSDEEAWGSRGRRLDRLKDGLDSGGQNLAPEGARSLLAAAEEERIRISKKQKIKSMLDPDTQSPGPAEKNKKLAVHPNTAFNNAASRSGSPDSSAYDGMDDIKRAQQLAIHMSPVDSSVPHRVIRTVIRGDFTRMQQEAEEGQRRVRTYIVATDLSSEAAYALEWTIGTVLRDGDTLLAMYCVDEELAKAGDATASPTMKGLPVGEGGNAIQETTETMARQTELARKAPGSISVPPSPLRSTHLRDDSSIPNSRSRQTSNARNIPRLEQERHNAVEDISATCVRFLRKTKLQVRIAVEVIHCKSPKHMITEAVSSRLSSIGIRLLMILD